MWESRLCDNTPGVAEAWVRALFVVPTLELGIVLEYWNISLVHLILGSGTQQNFKKQDLYDATHNQEKLMDVDEDSRLVKISYFGHEYRGKIC